jgi:uncharacterized protein (DUF433 family)
VGLEIGVETVPLRMDAEGVVRVGATRVTLDTLVAAFKDGGTAEEIVSQYPTIQLANVYSVIAYYLRRRDEVEEYLRQRLNCANAVRDLNESRFDPKGIRDRLLARRAKD